MKTSKRVSHGDLKGLLALSEETRLEKRIVVCMEPRERTTDAGVIVVGPDLLGTAVERPRSLIGEPRRIEG